MMNTHHTMPSGRSILPRPGSIVTVAAATRFLQWGILGVIIPVANLLRMSKGLNLPPYLALLAFQAASCAVLLFAGGFVTVSLGFGLYGVTSSSKLVTTQD